MNYPKKLNEVIDYIGNNLDKKLTLQQLSQIACLSKFHFHRLFAIHTGLSLQQFIRWLKLKRAAHQLIVDKNTPILDIAIDAGFESHEAFSRAFKQTCGLSPKGFRHQSSWAHWEKPPYRLHSHEVVVMKVDIKNIKQRRLAVLEHRGDPKGVGDSVNRLIAWAKSQPMNLKPRAGEAFGFAYDDPDPKITPPAKFRFDLAITVPDQIKLAGEIKERILPAGRYAVATHKGSRDTIGDTIYGLYRDWLPKSGEELGELPCIFSYVNFEHEVAETALLTECWLLLK